MLDNRGGAPLTRRQVVTLGAGVFALALAGIRLPRGRVLVARSLPLMGTVGRVVVAHRDPLEAEAAIDAAFERLREVERAMSRFDPASDVGRANALAGHDATTVGAATAAVLGEALRWSERSDGAFDPALARMAEIWDVASRRSPPPAVLYKRLAGRSLYRGIDLGTLRGTPAIRIEDRDAGLDLGGIAKGYGVDRAVAALRSAGIRHAVVDVGGDLYAMGRSVEGDPWRIGIRSPHDPARMVATIEVEEAAIATSGDYFQGFDHAGRRYHHLLDPLTAEPRRTSTHSLTVRAGTCLAADAGATAAYGMDGPKAHRLLAGFGAEVVHTA